MAIKMDGKPRYTIVKIQSFGDDNKINGKTLHEDYLLEGKLIQEDWVDDNGKKQHNEYREHIYPAPGKEVLIGGKKMKIHSIDIPKEFNKNKTINVH